MTTMNEATRRQIMAARPDMSTWVSANAGSGKTKVLTDRVARLLLDGTPPQHILCLTYTKAAAAEMQNRLFKRLGDWAMLPDPELIKELTALAPEKSLDSETLRHARTLFARAIETPGGLKIQTIHSFCSALLRRFPLEAGVSPQFKEMDDRQSRRMVSEIIEDIALGPKRDVIDDVALYVSDLDLTDLALSIVSKRDQFFPPRQKADIWSWFNLPTGYDETRLLKDVFLGGEKDMLLACATLMEASSASDQKTAALFRHWAELEPDLSLVENLCDKLLAKETAKTNPLQSKFYAQHSSLPTRKLIDAHPGAFDHLESFMKRVEAVRPHLFGLKDARKTLALHRFAQELLPPYMERKAELGLLDFDDMIRRARDLLSISNVSQWVLYRLDGGIDHILVDEAQDTSPDQWRVVQLLAGEFTAGEGARADVTRTIFVVGDHKQSIYSFQGAAPEAFDQMKEHFGERLKAVGQPLQDLSLQYSFRSSPAILTATDTVFAAIGGEGVGGIPEHIAFFDDIPGRVDLWSLETPEDLSKEEKEEREKEASRWEEPLDVIHPEEPNPRLAKRIANFVAEQLEHGSLPDKNGKGRKIEAGDILILVQRRSPLFRLILKELKSHPARIPVAGADRMTLNDEMAVKDLRSLLAFLSLQDDDLALAETLKSPLFNWSERDLYQLAHGRTTITLWRALYERRKEWPETFEVLEDLRQTADFLRPYDLIERVLIRHDGRRKFIARLGKEAEDGLDALLHQARNYETTETPSLTGFIAWLESQTIQLKRVLDENSNLVRVMTAHGSKGLEAPIVILPDTLKTLRETKDEFVSPEPDQIVWKGAGGQRSDQTKETLNRLKMADLEEDRRLLYVAMTRAEKWLIVCGAGKESAGTWYDLIKTGLNTLETETLDLAGAPGQRYAWGVWPDAPETHKDAASQNPVMPEWSRAPAGVVAQDTNRISPSDLGGAKALSGEEAALDKDAAMRRGSQLHRLIELLPDVAEDRREDVARFVLSTGEDPALDSEVPGLLHEALGVINQTYDWDVFGPNSLSEVPYTSTLNGHIIHGIIDRLIVTPDKVQIVDYKSNTVIPDRIEDIPEGLLRQLGAYAEACHRIYPDREIEVALLWTKTATLCPVPLNIVMAALGRAATS
ncbi:double-strand break repair helicase AddA [Celeribacter halophilus]|uniref:DNA 3'-5' helicase n=1 Tax=Celeribacter halophilus TaxID=576117 RepID=A0AAW7XV71_9RHOB|nr:double-strand break repair helicase AddA [Celeribacter halophilus]MDO6456879.1 double-strand break repair helicase AddA [Celeribacter halophilus]MDO6723541.1 double-strand break repair helicase AddA [Celeribacter halophilus]